MKLKALEDKDLARLDPHNIFLTSSEVMPESPSDPVNLYRDLDMGNSLDVRELLAGPAPPFLKSTRNRKLQETI